MNIFKLFRIALTALTLNVMRSILTMLGIIIGVSAVIIMVSIGAGAQQEVDAQLEGMGANVLIIFGGWNNRGGGGTAAVATLQESHANLIIDEVYGIEAATPYLTGKSQLIFGNLNWSADIMGTTNDFFATKNWDLDSGREFTVAEMSSGAKVVLIGSMIRDELFGASDPIGQTVRVGTFNATVIGVLEEKGPDARGSDQDDVAVMPLKTVRTNITGSGMSNPNSVSYLEVKGSDIVSMDFVEVEIENLLRQAMKVADDTETTPFRILDLAETVESRAETQAIFNTLLAAVASVSLVVGGIGIMNIMMVSVTERTREIGLRMALGAKPDDILNQFLVEAITLCGVGGLIGIGIAFGVTFAMETYFDMVTLINPEIVFISLGFSALIGVFFGYYPALKASRLQPIDALRYE